LLLKIGKVNKNIMGMFDTIIIEGLKLKASKEVTSFLKVNNAEFPTEYQTKDLNNALETYRINAKGDVFEDVSKPTGRKVPYELPFKDWPDNRPWLVKIYYNIKYKQCNVLEEQKLVDEVRRVKVKSKLTNTIIMYSYDEIGGRYVSLNYEVKIVEGKVKTIKLLEWEIEDEEKANKRIQNDADWKERISCDIAKRKSFQSTWYYPLLKETYNPFVFFVRIAVQKICSKVINAAYKWHGV